MDQRDNVKVRSDLHAEMQRIVSEKGNGAILKDEYELAITNHIKNYYGEKLIKLSGFEKALDDRIGRAERHLASMLGRTGMDVSIVLKGLMALLTEYLEMEEPDIMKSIRPAAAKYYSKDGRIEEL